MIQVTIIGRFSNITENAFNGNIENNVIDRESRFSPALQEVINAMFVTSRASAGMSREL